MKKLHIKNSSLAIWVIISTIALIACHESENLDLTELEALLNRNLRQETVTDIEFLESVSSMNQTQKKKTYHHPYTEKVINAGFEFEEYTVVTDDGYILSLWRVPRRLGEKPSNVRKPIILQHGVLDDSWTWFALNSTNCLPIMLAERNYDVWIPNSRGNMFSIGHLDPGMDSKKFWSKFWNFTWHEMAKYDLPAFVKFIKDKTGWEKLIWVGHSQGTFQFFISYLINPEFMENSFEKFVSIGTVATIFNSVNNIFLFLLVFSYC